jgi:hypothetical protein
MNPQDQNPAPLSPPSPAPVQVNNPLSVMQTGEQNIFELKRHPIGLIGTFIGAGVLIIVLAVVCFAVVPLALGSDHHSQAVELGALIFIVVTLLVIGFVAIANKVYWGNRWILTSDSLTQVLQHSLFDKQSSQLSLGNLEDVTAEQNGVFEKMFKYGVIRVETAGERSKFVFAYCPNPEIYAQHILRAREAFERRAGGDDQRLYRGVGSYAPAAPVPQAPYPPQAQPAPAVDPNPPAYQPLPPQEPSVPPPGAYIPPPPPADPGVNIGTEQ